MLAGGTTTFECKSGYGLSREAEMRALVLARELEIQVPQTTVSTALLAHAVPDGYSADEWMDVVQAMMPEVLGAGSVIHALHHAYDATHAHEDAQDMRNMGGLRRWLPVTCGCAGENFSLIHAIAPVKFSTPRRISISPTENSIERPMRAGITQPKRMIPLPTTKIVNV